MRLPDTGRCYEGSANLLLLKTKPVQWDIHYLIEIRKWRQVCQDRQKVGGIVFDVRGHIFFDLLGGTCNIHIDLLERTYLVIASIEKALDGSHHTGPGCK